MAITIRAATLADVRGIARVHVDSWRSTYRGMLADEYIDSITYESREQLWARIIESNGGNRQGFLFAACDGEEIVGFVSGGRSRGNDAGFEGEVTGLYILEQYQKMGIGRRLMDTAVNWLLNAGMTSMVVWVLNKNENAVSFYEHLGGKPIGTQQRNIGDKLCTIVGYRWECLGNLGV